MRSLIVTVLLASACGGGPDPILRNAPRPDPGVVAGAAAAVAGAATLAAPDAAAKKAEANKPAAEQRPIVVKETVPAGVLDRADEKQGDPPKDFAEQPRDPDAPPPRRKPKRK